MKERIERFRELVSEIDISKYKQKTFIKIVDAIFYELFLRPKGVWIVGKNERRSKHE